MSSIAEWKVLQADLQKREALAKDTLDKIAIVSDEELATFATSTLIGVFVSTITEYEHPAALDRCAAEIDRRFPVGGLK